MKIQRKARNIVNNRASVKMILPQNKKLGFSDYCLPYVEIVPADRYYSKIVHIEDAVTRSGKKAIAVYYKIIKFSDMYQKVNKLSDRKTKILHIKQIYPLDSQPYVDFLQAMHEALGIAYEEELDMEQIINVTETIEISYSSYSGIGGISSRGYWDRENFIELYQEKNAHISTIDEYHDIEYDEYGNVI